MDRLRSITERTRVRRNSGHIAVLVQATLTQQLQQQYGDAVKKRGGEYAFGRLVAVGIDIEGKENDIGQQAQWAQRGDQRFGMNKKIEKVEKGNRRKLNKVEHHQA